MSEQLCQETVKEKENMEAQQQKRKNNYCQFSEGQEGKIKGILGGRQRRQKYMWFLQIKYPTVALLDHSFERQKWQQQEHLVIELKLISHKLVSLFFPELILLFPFILWKRNIELSSHSQMWYILEHTLQWLTLTGCWATVFQALSTVTRSVIWFMVVLIKGYNYVCSHVLDVNFLVLTNNIFSFYFII